MEGFVKETLENWGRERFRECIKQAQESLGPGRLRSALRATMSQFQCLSCPLSSWFHYCSGCFSLARASSHISVLLPQVSAHLQECLRSPTGWWGACWGFPWATGKSSIQLQGWWPQSPGALWCYCFHCNLDKEPSWTPGREMRINTLRRADVLQRNRWKHDLEKSHKNQWVYSNITQALSIWSPALPWTTSASQTHSLQKAGVHTWTWPHFSNFIWSLPSYARSARDNYLNF